jgi:ABC-type lipoprotein release transport system permease subunit
MSVIWNKVWSDLWDNKVRTTLAVLSISAGVFAIGAMFDANLDYQYSSSAVFIWLVVIAVISVLASLLPARNATRISVRDSLAYA